MKLYRLFVIGCLLCLAAVPARAQKTAVKTNLLYWATSTPNLGAEFGLADRWTLDVGVGYNPFTWNKETNRKLKHVLVMPEARYWLCEAFEGHFFGLHAGGSYYNISDVRVPFWNSSTRGQRYQGWGAGVGLSYGYSWILGRRWNLEVSVGVGYVYTNYDQYECVKCGEFQQTKSHHYFGPTKAAINLVYLIK